MLFNVLPLVSGKLEYHAEWCALKSPSIRVKVVIIRWSREGRYPPARACWEYVVIGNDQAPCLRA